MFSDYSGSLIQLKNSLSPKLNRDSIFKSGQEGGRSGSFFFFSHDRKWIIKTMTDKELNLYLYHLQSFYNHYKHNKDSLLAKICGVFTIHSDRVDKVHIMLMENTMQISDVE
jgi:Phosphatidylinositol-4-phosphate 5-Kinase